MDRTLLNREFFRINAGLCVLVLGLMLGSPSGLWGANAPLNPEKNISAALPAQTGDKADDDAFMEDLLNETGAGLPVPASDEKQLPLQMEGELLSSLWVPDTDSTSLYTSNRLDLKAWGTTGDLEVKARLKIDFQDLEGKNRARADVSQFYAQYRSGADNGRYAEIALGKKIIYWGKADEVRPLDRVCPQDYTSFLFYDMNDRKTGRIGAFLNMNLDHDIRFEGFWSPYFEADKTPGLGDYFEPGALRKLSNNGIQIHENDSPDEWSADAGLGGRLMFSLFKADMAFYAFYGKDPYPTYIIDRVGIHPLSGLRIVPQSIVATYPYMTLLGADVERTAGPFVLRAEAAYQPDGAFFSVDWENHPLLLQKYPDGVVEKEQIQYVVGLDRNDLFVHNLFLNLQYFGEYILDHDADMVLPESRTGMTGLLRYSFLDSKAGFSYRLTAFFKGKDLRHHVELTYKPISWAQVAIGGIWYQGNSATDYFGQYDNKDFIYGKLKLVF